MDLPNEKEFKDSLDQCEASLPHIAETISLLWKTTPQFKLLLSENGAPGEGIKVTSQQRRFTTEKLTYIRLIYIHCENPEKTKQNLNLTIKPINKEPLKESLYVSKNYLYTFVSDFCEWFELSSDAKLTKPYITKVVVKGADISTLEKYSRDIENYCSLKSASEETVTKAQTYYKETLESISEQEQKIETLGSEIEQAESSLAELSAKKIELESEVSSKQSQISALDLNLKHKSETLTQTQNNHEQLTQKISIQNKEIINQKQLLEKLTSDRNLISDEYGPYVKEGKSQALIYVALASLPLAAIIFSIYEIYLGASKLLLSEYKSITELFAAFILRIPFAAVFSLAIFYSWKLTSSFIQKIFKIHSDRLALAKLLIIAREVVHSSTKNLNIPDLEKFQEQVSLKVEVLKSHLSKDLSNDFTYTPRKNLAEPSTKPIAANEPIEDDKSAASTI